MSYYNATELLKTVAERTKLITTVTHGDVNSADIKRQTLYPLMHIVPTGFSYLGSTIEYQFTLYFMDLVDTTKANLYDEADPFWGVDNTIDVFNAMTQAASMVADILNRDGLGNVIITLPGNATYFSNRFENALAGVEMQVTLTYPSAATTDGIC